MLAGMLILPSSDQSTLHKRYNYAQEQWHGVVPTWGGEGLCKIHTAGPATSSKMWYSTYVEFAMKVMGYRVLISINVQATLVPPCKRHATKMMYNCNMSTF